MFLELIVNDSIFTKTKIEFLKKIGADKVSHGEGTLLEHLINTSEILRDMGCEDFVQDAGLFHSVYGTAYFRPEEGLIDDRQVVIDLIGEQAEEIAYWFCILAESRSQEILKFDEPLRGYLISLDEANSQGRMMSWKEAYGI